MSRLLLIMKTTALTIALCAGLFATHFSAYADKTGYYRWADDDGKQHFTQQPPLGRKYHFVETRGGATMQSEEFGDATNETDSESGTDASSNNDAPVKMEIIPPKDPELCAKAKGNMQSLKANGARIRITNADGSSRMLNAEEIKEQEYRAQQVINQNCGQ